MVVQILYARRKTGETLATTQGDERAGACDGFCAVAGPFMERCEREHARRMARDASIEALGFPYPSYRSGQRDMMRFSYLCIMEGRRALVQAPTGTGRRPPRSIRPARAAKRGCGEDLLPHLAHDGRAERALPDRLDAKQGLTNQGDPYQRQG